MYPLYMFPPSDEQIGAIEAARVACRESLATLRNVPVNSDFDGSIDDIGAMSWMDYEGGGVPGGIETAALICGEVLRRAADLVWAISWRGDWFVVSREETTSTIAICPLARLHELEEAGITGGGALYVTFLEGAAFDCLRNTEGESARRLRAILKEGCGYLDFLDRTLESLEEGRRVDRKIERRRRGH